MNDQKPTDHTDETRRPLATPSFILADGTIGEMLYDGKTTTFAVFHAGTWQTQDRITGDDGRPLVPYSPQNNLVKHRVVLFPSEVAEYRDEQTLIRDIEAFIRRYVDVSPLFERLSSYYFYYSINREP